MPQHYDLIVAGGGPSGMLAAGFAASEGLHVLLAEKMPRPGRKIAITGKGRCNLTNLTSTEHFLAEVNANAMFLKPVIENFTPEKTVAFFNSMGVRTVTERGHRVFPASGKAFDIVDALVNWCNKNKVHILTSCQVTGLLIKDKSIEGITCSLKGKICEFHAPMVLLCTGGKSYPATGATGDGYELAEKSGHQIVKPFQSLVPLEPNKKIPGSLHTLILKNIEARLTYNGKVLVKQFGEMNFAGGFLSGPVVLTLSRTANEYLLKGQKITIAIDLKPALSVEKLKNRINRDINSSQGITVKKLLSGLLPSAMIEFCIQACGLNQQSSAGKLSEDQKLQLVHWLKNVEFEIRKARPWEEAIITAGGIDVKDIDQTNLASKKINGLFFAGEIIDIDANTGGYNLQIAFSTGKYASDAIIKKWKGSSFQSTNNVKKPIFEA